MKLLILTQKVNKNDPILGFFHRWLEEFAKNFEKVTVICLEKGEYSLPKNVKVLSLGKEKGWSKFDQLMWFYQYIWDERNNYNKVFVHMNQEYVLLGAPFWKLWRKKIYMWRNHYHGNMMTDLASYFCNKVFCTSFHSYTAKFKKTVFMPVGVDTNVFRPNSAIQPIRGSILSLGRISPSKNIHVLIEALGMIKDENFILDIFGGALPADQEYFQSLKEMVEEFGLNQKVKFLGPVENVKTPEIYRNHQIFVNVSRAGMYDKTILEATACGCTVIASSPDAKKDLPLIEFSEIDSKKLADKLKLVLAKTFNRQDLQYDEVKEKHSLKILVERLEKEMV